MSRSRVPDHSQKDIENFLTFLDQAKSNPQTDSQLWKNLTVLLKKLRVTEDKSVKLARVIKQWCEEFGIELNPKELAEFRVNMVKKGQAIPERPAGEKPAIVYNKALIVEKVNEEIDNNKSTKDHE